MFDDTNLRSAHKTALIIAYGMMFTLVVYALLVEFFLKDIDLFAGSEFSQFDILRYILIAVGGIEIIMMVIIRNRILSGKTSLVPKTSPPRGEALSPGMDENPQAGKEAEFIQRLQSSHIITYALCNSIGIYGLLLFLLGKDKTGFYAFLGSAFFLMMVHFPRYEEWKSRLEDFLND
jgi:hypothetical protein